MSPEIPEIRIIPIRNLIPHESEEPRRTEKLEERIMSDGFLKNPVIVGRIPGNNSRLLLLDGIHRIKALTNLGFYDVPAQVVDYLDEKVKLETWSHLIYDKSAANLLVRIKSNLNLELERVGKRDAGRLLQERKAACCLFLKNKCTYAVKSGEDLESRVSALINVANSYYGCSKVKRGSEMETTFLLEEHETAVALMRPPVYEKNEILSLALNKLRLPPGITRHTIPLRVLGFHVDIGLLRVNMTLEDKNELIHRMLSYRITNGKTRFYGESVLFFDD